jgi:hypothetical protein
LQFPERLVFAITIKKAQGQSLQVCGQNLENPSFSHGHAHGVRKSSDLFVYAPEGRTKNVVYPNAFQ